MFDTTANDFRKVLIVGGGFAGLACALELAQNSEASITLIDRNNYQQFQPLLYQVATGLLASSNAAFALREIVREFPNVIIQMADIEEIDLATRTAKDKQGRQWNSDVLVLALGSQVNFFGTRGAEQYSLPLYSLTDAERLRTAIFNSLESAGPVEPGSELNYVVVGGGPTGVEIAGTLADTITSVLHRTPHPASNAQTRVILVERGSSVLKAFSAESQRYAEKALARRGIEVRLDVAVDELTASSVKLSDGTRINTKAVIWAAGLKASSMKLKPDAMRLSDGRLHVGTDFALAGVDHVYAIGDVAAFVTSDGNPLPQLAAVAQQAGRHVAKSLIAQWAGGQSAAFEYRDRGILAMIGKNDAVAELGRSHHQLDGPLAFATWLGVHASLLPVVRAKIETILEWAWEYLTGERPTEIIDRNAIVESSASAPPESV